MKEQSKISCENLEAVINGMTEGLNVTDLEGNVVLVNEAAAKLLGFQSEQDYHRALPEIARTFELRDLDGRLMTVDEWPLARILRGETLMGFRAWVKNTKTGKAAFLRHKGQIVHSKEGVPTHALVTFRDCSKQVQAETAQEIDRRILDTALDAAEMGTWEYNFSSNICEYGSRAAALYGLSSLRILHDEEGVRRLLHPDDIPVMRDAVLAASDPSGDGRFSVEYRVRRPEGGWRWLSVWGLVVFSGNGKDRKPARMAGASRDITKTKEVEENARETRERFHAVLENSPDAVYRRDLRSDSYDYLSPVIEQVLGFGPEEMRFMPIASFVARIHPDDQGNVLNAMRRGMEVRRGWVEYRFLRKDGQYRWISDHFTVQTDSNGISVYRGGIIRDVTERKQAEEELQRLAAEREQLLESERAARMTAEKATRVKDDFLATISHELRTPLNAVLGWTALLRKKPQDLNRGLGIIERNARAQAQLVGDLLDMNRIATGRLEIEREQISPALVIRDAVEAVQTTAEEKGVLVSVSLDVLSRSVYGDHSRLRQVLWNILTNAVKFTPRGGEVSVSLTEDADWAKIAVQDNGEGIDPDFLPGIFQRFTQGEIMLSKRKGGLGIGLTISKHIMELHGGTIEAASEGKGHGSTFTIRLPLGEAAESVFVLPEHEVLSALPRGISILVVEDEADALEFLSGILREKGALVFPFSSPVSALKSLELSRPDLILSDIGMPDMDGYAFIRAVRGRHDDRRMIPAVAVTAFARKEDEEKAIQAGFTSHIAKPVNITKLVREITALYKEPSSGQKTEQVMVMQAPQVF